jgi:hypothetical protein
MGILIGENLKSDARKCDNMVYFYIPMVGDNTVKIIKTQYGYLKRRSGEFFEAF